MSDYRGSYRITALAALITAMLLLVLAIVSMFSWGESFEKRLFLMVLLNLCLALGSFAALVALGGVIALRRDTMERAGRPYFSKRPLERSPGLVSRLRRRALGLMSRSRSQLGLWSGEWVRVRPFSEIAATLDGNGCLEGLPFMPEMLQFCGKHFRVFRRIDKIYDYYTPGGTGIRRLRNSVTLDELRCNGEAHGGCQAACQLIWKEAWLEPATGSGADEPPSTLCARKLEDFACRLTPEGDTRYFCQITELPKAGPLMWWHDPRHYLRDLWSGNLRPVPFVKAVALALFNIVQRKTQRPTTPHREAAECETGEMPPLGLQPGDIVRIKPKKEIEKTLTNGKNRGLWFDGDMHRYCGGTFRVAARVETIVGEGSGRMLTMKNPCIVLEGVNGTGEYRCLCPQNELLYWREVWLERLSEQSSPQHAT